MSDGNQELFRGTPQPVFLPARSYTWRHVKGPIQVTLPLRGDTEKLYSDLDNNMEFNLSFEVEEDGRNLSVIDFSVLTKLMFCSKNYVDLKDDQMFSISSLVVDEELNQFWVIGHVLEKL